MDTRRPRLGTALGALFVLGALFGCGQDGPDYGYPLDDVLRINDLQVRGTHNSYHVNGPDPSLPADDTNLPPLNVQADHGIRNFELDLHYDPALGYQVYHLPLPSEDVSNCRKFADCLQTLKGWSDGNPGHVPLFVWFEFKDQIDPVKITDYAGIEAEILKVWPRERLIVPDDIQGDSDTLVAGLQEHGWPTLRHARDKAMFMLIDRNEWFNPGHRYEYTMGETTLRGRLIFVTEDDNLSSPLAAVAKFDPPYDLASVGQALAQNALLGTNIDSIIYPDARNLAERQAALDAHIHLLQSDFIDPSIGPLFFTAALDATPVGCNPQTAPAACTPDALENLKRVKDSLSAGPAH